MKQRLILFAALMAAMTLPPTAQAYDFSKVSPSGHTLYYTVINSTQHYVRVDHPSNGNWSNYVSGDLVIPGTVIQGEHQYTVTALEAYVFQGCTGLTSVVIPNTVSNIPVFAFLGCTGLTSFVVSEGLASIGNNAFQGCTSLTSLTFPDEVTSIGQGAFNECTGLTSVTFGAGLTSIGNNAFQNCSGLTSVTIPAGVTSIGVDVFKGCTGLTSIVVDAENTYYDSRDNCNAIIQTDLNRLIQGCNTTVIPNTVTYIENYAFYEYPGLTSVTIPISVTSIGSHAFQNCTNLTTVTIDTGVTTIGGRVFDACSSLADVYCKSTTPPSIGTYVFNNATNCTIHVPCVSVNAYKFASHWNTYISRIQGVPFFDVAYSFASSNEAMGAVSVGDVDCDSNVTVTAMANTGYQFIGWSDGGADNPRIFHITGDTAVSAIFLHEGAILHDTVYLHDTTVVVDTLTVDHYIYDTILIDNYIYDTVTETEYVSVYDTTYLTEYEYIHDTTYITLTDTVDNYIYDTVTNTVYDTIDNFIYDTTVVTDTLWLTEYDTIYITLHDTVYIHDTVYVTEEGIGDVEATSVKLYQRDGQIVVEGAEGLAVRVYDAVGREINGKRKEENGKTAFAVPASGVYLVRVGDHPARRIVVIR